MWRRVRLTVVHLAGHVAVQWPDSWMSMPYQVGEGIVPTPTYVVGSGTALKGDVVHIPCGWWIHRWLATHAKWRHSAIWTLG